jgi:uncharacterized protein (TIGR00255 family)
MKSMTGFGAAEQEGRCGSVRVEMRSYNHRYLDLRLKLHRNVFSLEARVHQWAKKRLTRGKVEIFVHWEEPHGEEALLQFRPEALRFYLTVEGRMREEFGLPGFLDIPAAMRMKEIVSPREEKQEPEETWAEVEPVLEHALRNLEEMQEREGDALRMDIDRRLESLSEELIRVEETARDLPEKYREKLEEKVARLMSPERFDAQRFAQEIVIYVDKMDITEEIVRLRSHLDVCKTALKLGELSGKRLDFLAQEILREVNTIGSKNTHPDIVYRVVNMKTELEKIREQAQNLL